MLPAVADILDVLVAVSKWGHLASDAWSFSGICPTQEDLEKDIDTIMEISKTIKVSVFLKYCQVQNGVFTLRLYKASTSMRGRVVINNAENPQIIIFTTLPGILNIKKTTQI